MNVSAGTRLGHFEILSPIGAGGMGEVYRAKDLKLGRHVAVKVLPPELSADPDRRARFEQEAYAASALNHPNIVTIHDMGAEQGVLYVAMELVEGDTLRQLLDSGALPAKKLLDVCGQAAEGLASAHAVGIVHRDLKPENVIVSKDGFVKILDFGLAKLVGTPAGITDLPTMAQHDTQPGALLGTVGYMSPEQACGKAVDFRSDQFSLGAILYEAATGQRAFRRNSAAETLTAIIREEPEPVSRLNPSVPAPLVWIVERCLAKDPSDRYASTLDLARDLRGAREHLSAPPVSGQAVPAPPRRRVVFLRAGLAAAALLTLAALGAWQVDQRAKARWARETAMPEIQKLARAERYTEASRVARKAASYVPSDSALATLRTDLSRRASIDTAPEGADVQVKDYRSPDGDWEPLGTTPLKDVQIPRGLLRCQIRKPGFRTVLISIGEAPILRSPPPLTIKATLDEAGKIPPEMLRVPGGQFGLQIPGLKHLEPLRVDDYLMDRHEVTNADFKKFLDAGGYRDRRYWKHDFIRDRRVIAWQEALAEFRDRMGRPGPATWELGSYPQGQGDHPVSGVSWYEAAAYAEFVGKRLPTVYHWNHAATPWQTAYIAPLSNLGGVGLAPVGKHQGWSGFGLFDVAGNVKEWCWNDSDEGKRYLLGGAWNELPYMFVDPDARSPWDRSPVNGFRLMKPLAERPPDGRITARIEWPVRNFSTENPVPNEVFRIYKALYSYDKADLGATVESVDDTSQHWRKEKVTFNAAYGGERVIAYLFLPRAFTPPYQAVAYFPGSNALLTRSSDDLGMNYIDFVIRSGRALIYPIYKSTYERGDALTTWVATPTSQYRDHVLQWSKDLGRSLDYLETRKDIDMGKLAYYGLSWGAALGAVLPAVEDRIKVCVLFAGGFEYGRSLPEVNPVNFAPHVTVPTLMVNGRFDYFFGVEKSQIPLFRLLGAPEKDKRHVVYEAGHVVPRDIMSKDVLDWLDRYLSPVK